MPISTLPVDDIPDYEAEQAVYARAELALLEERIKKLPPKLRQAMEKRMSGYALTATERQALLRARRKI